MKCAQVVLGEPPVWEETEGPRRAGEPSDPQASLSPVKGRERTWMDTTYTARQSRKVRESFCKILELK